jgi:hypothetical protein
MAQLAAACARHRKRARSGNLAHPVLAAAGRLRARVEGDFQIRVTTPPEAGEDLRDAQGRAMRLLTLRITPTTEAPKPR